MSEIEDFKNCIDALTHKVDSILKFIQTLKRNNELTNECMTLIHNMNYEKSREHQVIFQSVFPDIIRRISAIETQVEDKEEKNNEKQHFIKKSIVELDLSLRINNCLRAAGITTIEELLQKTAEQLVAIPNFGKGSFLQLKARLKELGLELKK